MDFGTLAISTRLSTACQQFGQRCTPQKQAVLHALKSVNSHPTPDDVYELVRVQQPQISKASVYRILEQLAAMNLATKVSHDGTCIRYDGNTATHQHLICSSCGDIIDVDLLTVDWYKEAQNKAKSLDFCVTGVTLNYSGICSKCQLDESLEK